MSGILSAIEAVGQLFGGYGLVTLGPVKFRDIEVPEFIPVGGSHALHVVKNPGGARIIQAMGRDDADMSWSGYLEGPQAESRMQLLDSVRQSGAEITLAFGQSSFQVVVSSFTAEYHRRNWIPYKVTVTVLVDNAAAASSNAPSLLDDLNNDINSAAGFNLTAAVQTTITTAQNAVNVAGALGLNGGAWGSAMSALDVAQTGVVGLQSAADGTISGVATAAILTGNVLGVSQISNAAGALNTLLTASGNSAAGAQALAFIGRAITNLAGASA